jgi:hypothetical protein
MAPGTTAQAGKLDFATLTYDQLSELLLHRSADLAAIAHQRGFSSADEIIAYEKGRPRYKNGSIVLCDTPGLSLDDSLNERAELHGMPPIGTKTISEDGIEWEIVNYGFFPLPAGLARYPNDSDYLPLVWPTGISERLAKLLSETDHCTSKHILFIDTMPSCHPFKLGEDLHYAISSSNPDESYILLDVANAHETTFAHEIAHLWLNYVQEDGDGMRRLREEALDNIKHMQLNFVQSFVVDLKVNDLIAERGFDMSSIRHDEIHGLTLLRDAFAIGYQPPTSREALLHSISIADAIHDQKRWPDEDKQQLAHLLEFFEAATPQIYQAAQELVEIVGRHGYDSREAIRKTLDECISLAFRATGDDFDIERDLEEFRPGESMKDKYPDELPGCPVPLKLEIAKTMARNGISGPCEVGVSASDSGMAQITTVDANGARRGPVAVNYQIMPPHQWFNFSDLPHHRSLVGGKIPDTYGRLPGDAGYNTANPLGTDPFSRTEPAFLNGRPVEEFGRLPGEPGYNTCFSPGHSPFDQINAVAGFGTTQAQHISGQPWHPTPMHHPPLPLHGATRPHANPFSQSLPDASRHNPMLPGIDLIRPYMAGVGLAVASARLAQQMEINSGLDANAYQYAYNNPVIYVDPEGMKPTKHPSPPKPKPKPKPACPPGYTLKFVTAYGDNAGCSGSGCDIAYPKQCGCKNRLPESGDCAIDQHNNACQPGQYIIIQKHDGTTTSCRACDAGQGHGGIDFKVPGPNTVDNVSQYWDTGHYCVICSDKKP